MLMYKAWCETRSRFAIGAATLAVLIAIAVGRAGGVAAWTAVDSDSTKTVFVLLAIVLGIGSLRQERAAGTLGFSLALPVARSRLVAARAATGAAEIWLLALFVALWVPAIAAVAGPGYPISQALQFAVLWGACGTLILCLAQLVATLVASDPLAFLGTLLIVTGYETMVQLTALREQPLCDLYRLMSGGGEPYVRAGDAALRGLPWAAVAGAVALAGGLLGLAGLSTRRLAL